MAKKKKNGGQRDTRGYATSNSKPKPKPKPNASSQSKGGNVNTSKMAGKSVRKVQVSQSAQDQIASLLDELKQSLVSSSSFAGADDGGEKIGVRRRPIDFSVDDKKVVKKIAALNDRLKELGFQEDQIKSAFVAVVSGQGTTAYQYPTRNENDDGNINQNNNNNPLSLDPLLDWLCMHLPTEELPKLFTDISPLVGGDEKLSKVTFEGTDKTDSVEGDGDGTRRDVWDLTSNQFPSDTSVGANETKDSNPNVDVDGGCKKPSTQNGENDKVSNEVDEEAAERKRWLLQQYQYDDDSNDEEDNGPNDDTAKVQEDVVIAEKSIEEVRLEKLEKQIKEDRDSLNDDAANYMRSKYEIADLKKQLKKAEQQAKGLRAKIAKQRKAKEAEEAAAAAAEETGEGSGNLQNDELDEDYNGGISGLFGDGVAPAPAPAPAPARSGPVTIASSTPSTYVPTLSADIPSGWTGKTPKVLFLEHCRKKKIPKPFFSKMPGTRNGCSVRIKGGEERIIEHVGPFSKFKDAEHFVSTKALYALAPELPLYQLLPPIFRDLWKSWDDEKEANKIASYAKEEDARDKEIMALVRSIDDALPTRNKTKKDKKEEIKVSVEEAKTLVDWDEESWNSEDAEEQNLVKATAAKVVISITAKGKKMKETFEKKQNTNSYQDMKKIRESLPMYKYRMEFLDTVKQNAVTVLCAETGAGKTTQCPQFLLEQGLEEGLGDKTSIICTQPRRISALSVAERVAEEMDENIGDHVGYQIRMEARRSKNTRLMFCTTGVILRRLQDDPNLTGVSCVCVDECHERQWQIDFLLIALRKLIQTTRKDLKIVLMSATLDSELFCSFFGGAPFLSIPGRTFPVNQYYLEDALDATGYVVEEDSRYALRSRRGGNTTSMWVTGKGGEKKRQVVSLESELESLEVSDRYEGYSMSTRRSMEIVNEEVINYELIEDLLSLVIIDSDMNRTILPPENATSSLISNGSVLVFLPGIGEIRVLNDILKSNIHFGDETRFQIIPMHSTLSPKDQKRAFIKTKEGCRKIILATNIAETSITIADCVFVIDTGLERQIVQNKRSSTSTLVTGWCSRASSKQRAGRAGRVQPGICCKLYSSNTANVVMKKQSTPELQRVPLEEVCLSILAGKLSDNCMDFLLQAPQPPSQESVSSALKVLEEVGAINPISTRRPGSRTEAITPLGTHLSKLPVHVRLGKMLIFGALFGALDTVLTIVASMNAKSPFITNMDGTPKEHRVFFHPTSDFLTACNAWEAYVAALDVSSSNVRKFCTKNFLNRTAFIEIGDMRKQFLQLLSSIGFVDKAFANSIGDLKSSRFNRHGSKEDVINAAVCAGLYPNVAHITNLPGEAHSLYHKGERLYFHKSSTNHNKQGLESEWVIFQEKFATSRTFVSTTSLIKPFSLLLFGNSVTVKHVIRKVVVDDWIEVNISAQVGVMFRELKSALSHVIKDRMNKDTSDERAAMIIDGICRLFIIEGIENR